MKKHQLILSSDYEIFGNGSGDIQKCLIEPAEKISKIAERHGHKICFYVDVCEFWAFEEAEEKGLLTSPFSEQIKKQLIDFIKRGHDVQLHLHPQWIGAHFDETHEKWKLNYKYWRLYMVEELSFKEFGDGVFGLINKGKQWLERLIQPVKPNYECNAFRAGAWCIQPEENVLKALKKLGFKTESSAAPGMVFNGNLTYFDFRQLKNHPSEWKLGNKLQEIDFESELIEKPIATAKCSLFRQLQFTYLKKKRANRSTAEACVPDMSNKESSNYIEKFKRYILPAYRMLDFSAGSTFEEMKYITEFHIKRHSGQIESIVAISHPKNFSEGSEKEFEKYLEWFETVLCEE